MIGSLPINLVMSLVFGVGQIVVGGWLAWHVAHGGLGRWRQALLVAVGLWFVVSGCTELFVSGMETSLRLSGAPAAVTFALWRGRADTTLYVATAALLVGAVAYGLAPLLMRRRSAPAVDAQQAPREGEQSR